MLFRVRSAEEEGNPASNTRTKPSWRSEKSCGKLIGSTATFKTEEIVHVSKGVGQVRVHSQWYRLSNQHWAWKLHRAILQCCDEDSIHTSSSRTHERLTGPVSTHVFVSWTPCLLYALGLEALEVSSEPPCSIRRLLLAPRAVQIPPELLERIYGWDDVKLARTCRAVCRHWEKRCRGAAFRSISLQSERKVLDLVRKFKYDKTWKHIPSSVEEIDKTPDYTCRTSAPWVHLFDPSWRRSVLTIRGPFPGLQTIRSIHFSLPRSPPPSFSKGIRELILKSVQFRCFEHTSRLVSELPDLEKLVFSQVTWVSLSPRLPHQLPRANRNDLKWIEFYKCKVPGVELPPFALAALTLFLGVKSPSAFFPLGLLSITQALVQIQAADYHCNTLCILLQQDSEGRVRSIDISTSSHTDPFLTLRHRAADSLGSDTFLVAADARHMNEEHNHDTNCWTQLNSAIGSLTHSYRLFFLFGFDRRDNMLRFAADVVDKQLVSLANHAEMRYAVLREKKRESRRLRPAKCWYEATLDSEALRGEGVKSVLNVYSDWQ